jgi:hypothetical protein
VADAVRFLDDLAGILWIALAVAIGVFVVAGAWRVLTPVGRWIEVRALPIVTRRARVHYGLPSDAPPWACELCGSVNLPTATACYRCGLPRPVDAPELREAASDPGIFHPREPVNRFDPSRYRGPGAPPSIPSDRAQPPPGDER